jgi:hypothetical protein
MGSGMNLMWHFTERRLYVKNAVHIRTKWLSMISMDPDLLYTVFSEIQWFTSRVYNMAILHKYLYKLETTLKYFLT